MFRERDREREIERQTILDCIHIAFTSFRFECDGKRKGIRHVARLNENVRSVAGVHPHENHDCELLIITVIIPSQHTHMSKYGAAAAKCRMW